MMISTRSMLLPALLLACACSSMVRTPEVRLDSVRVGGIGLRGGTLYARVYVGNPNGFGLETRSITYAMQVEHPDSAGRWVTLTQDTVQDPVRIEGNSSKIIEVPIQFRYDDLGGAVRSVLATGTFNYRVQGDVLLSEPIGRTIPYSKTGVVSLTGVRD